jgi:hypothetical protein
MALMLRANILYHMLVNLAEKNETVIKPQVRGWNPQLDRRRVSTGGRALIVFSFL